MPTAEPAFVVSSCRFGYHSLNIKITQSWNAKPIKIRGTYLTDPPFFLRVTQCHSKHGLHYILLMSAFPIKADISREIYTAQNKPQAFCQSSD